MHRPEQQNAQMVCAEQGFDFMSEIVPAQTAHFFLLKNKIVKYIERLGCQNNSVRTVQVCADVR